MKPISKKKKKKTIPTLFFNSKFRKLFFFTTIYKTVILSTFGRLFKSSFFF
ncbi:hypothetical protein QBC42DRAFT_205219, partial [Cladorrhinum samala]